jgi:hypothetical protein
MGYVGFIEHNTSLRRERVRALVLAALLVASFAAVAEAENDSSSIRTKPDSTLLVGPPTATVPFPLAEPAPPAAAPQQAPPAVQPAEAPAPAPVVAQPWPENVPSLKPGTDKSVAIAAKTTKTTRPPTTTAAKNTTGTANKAATPSVPVASQSAKQSQVAALPPQPTNAASLTPVKVTLQATIIQGSPPLHEPLVWTVSKPGQSNKQIGLQVASMTGPRGEFSIPPGDYVVTIKQREAVVTQPLTVGAVPVAKTIVLNTSIVAVRMIPYTGGRIVTDPIHWEVFATGLGAPGPNSKVADAVAPQSAFMVTAGYYVVRSHYHGVDSDLAMLVEPGLSYSYTVDLYAANVVAQASGPSKAMSQVKWQLVRSTPEADGTHHVVAENTGANPTFLVREGNYMLIATGADGSVGEAPLAVIAGRTHTVRVTLKPGATQTVKTSTNG